MRIAIIGAGFCGLAAAWHLLYRNPSYKVTIFDHKGIGGGASGIASGLLHPFAGAHSKLNRMGLEGMQATIELLKVASLALGKPVAYPQSIVRVAVTPLQETDYIACAKRYPAEVDWWDRQQCQQWYPPLISAPGLFIKKSYFVSASLYLEGLWKACEQKGAALQTRSIGTLADLQNFDHTIIAAGAECPALQEISHLPHTIVKGQLLKIEWPRGLSPLPGPINSHAYLIMCEDNKTCLVGSTFEKDFSHALPDAAFAKQEIMSKVIEIIPALKSAPVLECSSGLRYVTPDKLPLHGKIADRQWIITGMGSKGLLYHALTAEKLVNEIIG